MSQRVLGGLVICVVLCAGAAGVAVGQQRSGPDPDVVLKREQQRVQYLVSRQYDQLAEMISPTLSYTHSNGALDDKDRFLADLRSGRVVYRKLTHSDLQVRFVGHGVAILNGVSDVEVTVGGQDQQVPLRFTIVYVERDGQWLFESWQSTRRPPA